MRQIIKQYIFALNRLILFQDYNSKRQMKYEKKEKNSILQNLKKRQNNNSNIFDHEDQSRLSLQKQIIRINSQQSFQSHTQQKISEKKLYPINKNEVKIEKRRQIIKRKVNFESCVKQISKGKQSLGKFFINTLKNMSIQYPNLMPEQINPSNRKFPTQIVSILYRLNIRNYNPYIQALDKLVSFKGKISSQKIERIKKICYIGVAKNYFKSQKYTQTPKYRQVNILIRTYMYENMRNIVQQKAQNYKNIVFIPCNKNALSFKYSDFPEELREICSGAYYQSTIKNVNKIIERQYIQYKKISLKQTATDSWSQNIIYFITLLCIIIFVISQNTVLTYIIATMVFISVILYLYEGKVTLSMLGSSKNMIQKIQNKLQSYLKNINSNNIQWKVGKDFYWLEIHYIRRNKRVHKRT